MIESLDVILWDKKVGTLVANREGHRSKACFYFDSDYVRNGYDIAPLRAPVKGVAAQRGLPVYPDEERLFGGLPSFIADSLPDHWNFRNTHKRAIEIGSNQSIVVGKPVSHCVQDSCNRRSIRIGRQLADARRRDFLYSLIRLSFYLGHRIKIVIGP